MGNMISKRTWTRWFPRIRCFGACDFYMVLLLSLMSWTVALWSVWYFQPCYGQVSLSVIEGKNFGASDSLTFSRRKLELDQQLDNFPPDSLSFRFLVLTFSSQLNSLQFTLRWKRLKIRRWCTFPEGNLTVSLSDRNNSYFRTLWNLR